MDPHDNTLPSTGEAAAASAVVAQSAGVAASEAVAIGDALVREVREVTSPAQSPNSKDQPPEDDDGEEEEEDYEDDTDDYSFDEEAFKHIVEDIPEPIMGKDNPGRMKLNSQELYWALDIRAAIEDDPEIDNLSDFMYSQLAINCQRSNMGRGEGIVDVLKRARGLQSFRQQFEIADTYEDGCRALKTLMELFPEQFLYWNFSEPDGTWVVAFDIGKVDTSVLSTKAQHQAYLAGFYYSEHAYSPDLETSRKGYIAAVECEGIGGSSFHNNFKAWFQVADKLLANYPSNTKTKFYHTSAGFNNMVSIIKKTMIPKGQWDRFAVGVESDCRLNDLFLVPNAKVAKERVLCNMLDCLKRHYDNEKQFSIPQTGKGGD